MGNVEDRRAQSGRGERGADGAGRPGVPPSRRERKKLETRAALEAAAMRLFAERGYEQTTVEEIAEAADVAVRTFFRHFQSKQHVLLGDVAHNVVGRMREALQAQPSPLTPLQAVGQVLRGLDHGQPDQYDQILNRLRLLGHLPELRGTFHLLFAQLHDVIAEFVAERAGTPVTDLYPQLVAAAATGAVKAALSEFEASDGQRSLDDLRDEAYAALTAGIVEPPSARR